MPEDLKSKKKSPIKKLLLFAILFVFVVATIAHFYVNSPTFLRNHVIPVVSKAIGKPIQAELLHFTAFSHFGCKGLTVGEDLLKADEIDIRYKAFALLTKRQLVVESVRIRGVSVTYDLREHSAPADAPEESQLPAQSETEMPAFLIQDIGISDVQINLILDDLTTVEIRDLMIQSDRIENDQEFRIVVAAEFAYRTGDQEIFGTIDQVETGTISQSLDSVALQLALSIRDLAAKAPGIAPPKHDITINSAFELRNASTLRVSEFAFDVKTTGIEKPVVHVKLGEPFEMDLKAATPPIPQLEVVVDDFDVSLLQPLLPQEDAFSLFGGLVNASINAPSGERLIGTIAYSDGKAVVQGETYEDLSATVDFSISPKWAADTPAPSSVEVERAAIQLSTGTTPLLLTDMDGILDLKSLSNSKGQVRIQTTPDCAQFAGALLGYGLGQTSLEVTLDLAEEISGTVRVKNITVTGPELPALAPVDVLLSLQGRLGSDATETYQPIDLQLFKLVVTQAQAALFEATLQPCLIDTKNPLKLPHPIVLTAALHETSSSLVSPFLPPEIDLDATVAMQAKVTLKDPASQALDLETVMSLRLDRLNTDAGKLVEPVAIETNLDAAYNGSALTLKSLQLAATPQGTSPLQVAIHGVLHPPAEQAEAAPQSKLTIDIPTIANVDSLTALWKAQERDDEEPAEEKPDPDREAPPNVWLDAQLTAARVQYGAMNLDTLKLMAQLKDGSVKVTECTAQLNEQPLKLTATADLANTEVPFAASFSLDRLNLEAVTKTFAPKLPVTLRGEMTNLALDAAGSGTDWPAIREQLRSSLNLEIDELTVDAATPTVKGASQLLFSLIGLSWQDLSFLDGKAALTTDAGKLAFEPFLITGDSMKLESTGTVSLASWIPDLQLRVGAKGGLATKMKERGIALNADSAGYEIAPSLPITADWRDISKTIRTEWQPKGAGILGAVEALGTGGQAAEKGGKTALQGLIGVGSDLLDNGEEKASSNKEQNQVQENPRTEAVLGILGNVLQNKPAEKKKQEQPAEEEKKEEVKTELIRGIFNQLQR